MAQATLHRSVNNRVIAGVCGGLAEYFNTDPTFIRVIFIALSFWGGVGLLLYLILVIIMPIGPVTSEQTEHTFTPISHYDTRTWLGFGLLIVGGLFLLNNLHLSTVFFPVELSHVIIPLLIIYLGVWFLTRNRH